MGSRNMIGHNLVIVTSCLAPVCARSVGTACSAHWWWLHLGPDNELRHLNFAALPAGVESDPDAIGARHDKVPHRCRGVGWEGIPKLYRSMATFMIITVRDGLASHAGYALSRFTQD